MWINASKNPLEISKMNFLYRLKPEKKKTPMKRINRLDTVEAMVNEMGNRTE